MATPIGPLLIIGLLIQIGTLSGSAIPSWAAVFLQNKDADPASEGMVAVDNPFDNQLNQSRKFLNWNRSGACDSTKFRLAHNLRCFVFRDKSDQRIWPMAENFRCTEQVSFGVEGNSAIRNVHASIVHSNKNSGSKSTIRTRRNSNIWGKRVKASNRHVVKSGHHIQNVCGTHGRILRKSKHELRSKAHRRKRRSGIKNFDFARLSRNCRVIRCIDHKAISSDNRNIVIKHSSDVRSIRGPKNTQCDYKPNEDWVSPGYDISLDGKHLWIARIEYVWREVCRHKNSSRIQGAVEW
jgi:hypothetical protein